MQQLSRSSENHLYLGLLFKSLDTRPAIVNRPDRVTIRKPIRQGIHLENELFENFRERIGSRSALVISYRLSTVRLADRIHVLERGEIRESGSHDELIQQRGVYHHLFMRQGKHDQTTIEAAPPESSFIRGGGKA